MDATLWIIETNNGPKRTYARNKREAIKKVEGFGLQVKSVRKATEKDFPEYILNVELRQ